MQALKRILAAGKTAAKKIDVTRFTERFGETGRTVVSLAVVVLVTTSTIATVMAASQTAHIVCDGKQQDVEVTSENTDQILQAAGIKTGPHDIVARSEAGSSGISITVRRAVPVQVSCSGRDETFTAHWGDTVGRVLSQAGIVYDADDKVEPAPSAKVSSGMDIVVLNRYHISVTADGKTSEALVNAGPVSEELAQAGVKLNPEDQVSVKSDSGNTDEVEIAVTRVSHRQVTQTESIAYMSVTQKDSTLPAGTSRVATQGRAGTRETVVSQKIVDGKVAESKVVQTSVTVQPVNQVTVVGTHSAAPGTASVSSDGTVVDQNGNAIHYRRVVSGRCSAYTGGGYTSTGRKAAFGLVAVNPNVIPYGTRMYICSPDGSFVYGYAIAADTGGAAQSGAIVADLYYDTRSQCIRLGSRRMNLYIL